MQTSRLATCDAVAADGTAAPPQHEIRQTPSLQRPLSEHLTRFDRVSAVRSLTLLLAIPSVGKYRWRDLLRCSGNFERLW